MSMCGNCERDISWRRLKSCSQCGSSVCKRCYEQYGEVCRRCLGLPIAYAHPELYVHAG